MGGGGCAALLRTEWINPKVRDLLPLGFGFLPAIEAALDEAETPSRAEPLGHDGPPHLPARHSGVGSEPLQCPGRPGRALSGPRGDHASCSPSRGALAPIQEATEVPDPILARGPRTLSVDLAGIPRVFLKESYSQQFYHTPIWGILKTKSRLSTFMLLISPFSPCCKAGSFLVPQV